MTLNEIEAEAARLRDELAQYLSMANQAHVCLATFGRQLGRLEERIDMLRANGPEALDRHEGTFGPASDCQPVLPERLT